MIEDESNATRLLEDEIWKLFVFFSFSYSWVVVKCLSIFVVGNFSSQKKKIDNLVVVADL